MIVLLMSFLMPPLDFPILPAHEPGQIVDVGATARIELVLLVVWAVFSFIGLVMGIVVKFRKAAVRRFCEENTDIAHIYHNGRWHNGVREKLIVRRIDGYRPHKFRLGVYALSGRKELGMYLERHLSKGNRFVRLAPLRIDVSSGNGYFLLMDDDRCRLLEIPEYNRIDKNIFEAAIEQCIWNEEFIGEQDIYILLRKERYGMNLTFREATREDCVLILSFIKELAEYEKMADEVVATPQLLEEWIFDKQTAEAFFPMIDGKEVGFAVYCKNFSTFLGRAGMYLEDIYVQPEYRGQGIGKAALMHLMEIAKQRGYGRMEWVCLDWNTPSIEFYLKLGAEQLSEWTTYRLTRDDFERLT